MGIARQPRASKETDKKAVDGTEIIGHGNFSGDYDAPASIHTSAEVLQAKARGAVIHVLEDWETLNEQQSQDLLDFGHEEDVLCSLRSLFKTQSPSANTAVVFSQISNPRTRYRQRQSPYGTASKSTGGLREKPGAAVRDREAKVDFEEGEIEE